MNEMSDLNKRTIIMDECDELGLTRAYDQWEDKWFHVDQGGNAVYTERFDDVLSFHEGLSVVENDGFQFHIHPDGKPAYEHRFDLVTSFRKGAAKAWFNGRVKWIRPDGSPRE